MNKKSVVVFDFDGVLTKGGEGLKQEAWGILVLPWNNNMCVTLNTHKENISGGKGSRYDILDATFSNLEVGEKYSTLLTAAYADCYNIIVQKLLEQSGMPEGTEQALAEIAKGRELFVNSATPEKAVRESVQNFGIAQHFRGIFGQPSLKVENLARAMKIAQVDKEFMLFVSDCASDWNVAVAFGCDFVGVKSEWNKWKKNSNSIFCPCHVVCSIAELPALLA